VTYDVDLTVHANDEFDQEEGLVGSAPSAGN